jgi:NO-binding membrane sensor protein with MHYT domain/CheY-like chemotaxis protein
MGFALADCGARSAGKARWRWLAAGAAVLGLGIWAAHFVGVSSSAKVLPAQYGLAGVLSALTIIGAGAFGALALARAQAASLATSAAAGFVLAITLLAVPLLVMRGPGWTISISYHVPPLFGSAALAMAGCLAAFRLDSGISSEKSPSTTVKASGAVLLGLTIVATHYAATSSMTFIEFYPAPAGGHALPASLLSELGIAAAVIAVLAGAAAVAISDKRISTEAPKAEAAIEERQNLPLPVKQEVQEIVGSETPVTEESVELPSVETSTGLTPNILSLSAAVALSAKTVLVADSSLGRQSGLQSLLAGWQMNPIFAPTAGETLKELAEARRLEKPIDLMLVDSRLDGGGFGLVEKLQTMQPGAPPVVMLLDSADGSQQLEKRGKLRVAAHVVKPIWRADLEQAMLTALLRRDFDQQAAAKELEQPPAKEGVSSRLRE